MRRANAVLRGLICLVCLALVGLSTAPLAAADHWLPPLAVALPLLLMMLGATRRSGSTPTLLGLGVVLLGLEATTLGLLLLRGEPLTGPAILGLPLPAALLLFGLGVLPLPIVGLLFAGWFGGDGEQGRPAGERLP